MLCSMNTAGSLNPTIPNQNDIHMNLMYRRDLLDYILNYMNSNRMDVICSNSFIMDSLLNFNPQLSHNTVLHNNQFYSTLIPYLFPMDLNLNSLQQQHQNHQIQNCTNDWLVGNDHINNNGNNTSDPTLMYLAVATQCILRYFLTTHNYQQILYLNSFLHSNYSSTSATYNNTSSQNDDMFFESPKNTLESNSRLLIHQYLEIDHCNSMKINENSSITPRIKRYKCTYPNCTKAYYKRSHLNEHYHLHTGAKPHLCNQPGCNARFTRADQLSRHRRAHTGERNFHCNVCLKRFKRSDHLKVHLTRNVCTKFNL
ncbi:unnamed protein product [Schistosoma rodhaini]|uniref:Kruppel-like factor 13,14,16 n=1 Tax=Schistosoma mansoni TaxID=6183 RepID=G4VM66_SCHMA|nr:kruppel-like factor 13,14,16 [Schistosoma mansoni]CAH8627575.1 unnamed protein product [Schistosoma rodhaini]|eukprot:XP_018653170.1 kruppel-like factor 13,14,16 [Schistosoma mansoni]